MANLDLYRFTSFQDYFHFWVSKEQQAGLSLGQIARKLNMYSNAEITNILKGRRKVSNIILEKFKNYNQYSEEDNYYLDLISDNDRNACTSSVLKLIQMEISSMQNKYNHNLTKTTISTTSSNHLLL